MKVGNFCEYVRSMSSMGKNETSTQYSDEILKKSTKLKVSELVEVQDGDALAVLLSYRS